MYITMVSSPNKVCKIGYFVAVISAFVETDEPEEDIRPVLDIIDTIRGKIVTISEIYEPASNFTDNIFITKSLDHQSHFETATEDFLTLYKKITGKDLDLPNLPNYNEEE